MSGSSSSFCPLCQSRPAASSFRRDHAAAAAWIVHQNWRTSKKPEIPGQGRRNAPLSRARVQCSVLGGLRGSLGLARHPHRRRSRCCSRGGCGTVHSSTASACPAITRGPADYRSGSWSSDQLRDNRPVRARNAANTHGRHATAELHRRAGRAVNHVASGRKRSITQPDAGALSRSPASVIHSMGSEILLFRSSAQRSPNELHLFPI